jgi:hypothetical protein
MIALWLPMAACGGGEDLPCTQVAAESGLQVSLPRFGSEAPRVTVTTCVDDRCVTQRGPTADRRLRRMWIGGDLDSTNPVTVRVVVRDSNQDLVFDGHTTVTPVKHQPNGAGCEPTAYVGAVRGDGRHTLTAEKLGLG